MQISTIKFNPGSNPAIDKRPIQGKGGGRGGQVEILLAASYCSSRDKLGELVRHLARMQILSFKSKGKVKNGVFV